MQFAKQFAVLQFAKQFAVLQKTMTFFYNLNGGISKEFIQVIDTVCFKFYWLYWNVFCWVTKDNMIQPLRRGIAYV